MEKRHIQRRDKFVKVWIYREKNTIALATTKNVTRNGMYLCVDGLLFPKDAQVEIAFTPQNDKTTKRLVAEVKHRNLNGIGVSFLKVKK